jgi:succinylarginine dihydrolase
MTTYETNFDGLVGPSHNYAGLSLGNIASTSNKNLVSNPKNAAIQGLEKMKFLVNAGYTQGVLAPHLRPNLQILRQLGFIGLDKQVLKQANRYNKNLVAACYSASNMWVANAATVSPSADTLDGKVHFTPANLASNFHRSIEANTTAKLLKLVFKNNNYFIHHDPLPNGGYFDDEGAANHIRLCDTYKDSGVEIFVYGRCAFNGVNTKPKKFPARQTFEAAEAIARNHKLNSKKVIFLQQNSNAIDKGVFHNDVISVGNKELLFCHEYSYENQRQSLKDIRHCFGENFKVVQVSNSEVSIDDALNSYLFNSQLLEHNNKHRLLVPLECKTNNKVWKYLNKLIDDASIIDDVIVQDLKQSMNNGGGPACLRLRVVLTEQELQACNTNCLFSNELYQKLLSWINKHYRDRLAPEDLLDENLLIEIYTALDELTQILDLGDFYSFQK